MIRPTTFADHDASRDLQLDAYVRARHAEALHKLSPQVRAQLAQRRNAALRGQPSTARGAHRLQWAAAGFATLCALAIGLQFLRPAPPVPAPAAPVAPPASTEAPSLVHAPSILLDEDPEFYAWLGTADARQIGLE